MAQRRTREQMIRAGMRIRKLSEIAYRLEGGKGSSKGTEESIETRSGKVRVLKYGFEEASVRPLYIDLHGGGFILMHADADETMNVIMSRGAGVKIVSVDYPKAPEHPYPAALDAVRDVIRHYVDRAAEYGLDAAKLGIGGHSAGANLSVVICMRDLAAGEFGFKYQILDYPPLDLATDPFAKPRPKGCIPPKMAACFNACYVEPAKAEDPCVSPVFASIEQLKALPPALVIVAGFDSLRDEAVKFAGMMQAAGVEVALREFGSQAHGFTYKRGPDSTEAHNLMVDFMKRHI